MDIFGIMLAAADNDGFVVIRPGDGEAARVLVSSRYFAQVPRSIAIGEGLGLELTPEGWRELRRSAPPAGRDSASDG